MPDESATTIEKEHLDGNSASTALVGLSQDWYQVVVDPAVNIPAILGVDHRLSVDLTLY